MIPRISTKRRLAVRYITIIFFLLILACVAGYAYKSEFAADKLAGQNGWQSLKVEQTGVLAPSSSGLDSLSNQSEPLANQLMEEKVSWESEKNDLQDQILHLKKENEALKKQMVEGIPFTIHPGESILDIANAAQKAGIVADSTEFQRAIAQYQAADHLTPGTYMVMPGTDYGLLIEQFTKGIIKKKE